MNKQFIYAFYLHHQVRCSDMTKFSQPAARCQVPCVGPAASWVKVAWEVASAQIQLPLMPPGKFKVRSVINNKDTGVFTKDDWAHGVEARFAGTQSVEILEVTPIN